MTGLRILHVTTTINRGGAENHLRDLIVGQVEEGHEIACAYLKGDGYWRGDLEGRGVRTADLKMVRYGAPGPARRLRGFARRFHPDVVHAHGAPAEIYALAAVLGLPRRPRLLITRHEHRRRLFRIPGYRQLDRLLSRLAARVIAVSDAVRETDIARTPQLAGKVAVVHHGIELPPPASEMQDARARVRAGWGLGPDAMLIGTLARHSEEKSLDTLIRAFARLRRSHEGDTDLRLALVGSGHLTDELAGIAEAEGVADALLWPGYRDDVADVLAAFDIFALPSLEEGFGLAVIEAMAAGRPAVVTALPALMEIVRDGETGMVVPPADSDALAAALDRLIASPSSREAMGAAGRRLVEREFSLAAMRSKTAEVYAAATA